MAASNDWFFGVMADSNDLRDDFMVGLFLENWVSPTEKMIDYHRKALAVKVVKVIKKLDHIAYWCDKDDTEARLEGLKERINSSSKRLGEYFRMTFDTEKLLEYLKKMEVVFNAIELEVEALEGDVVGASEGESD